jgi:hypothetical protein
VIRDDDDDDDIPVAEKINQMPYQLKVYTVLVLLFCTEIISLHPNSTKYLLIQNKIHIQLQKEIRTDTCQW